MAAVDNCELARWRCLDASCVLIALACHAKSDASYEPVKDKRSVRWHANVDGQEFELLLTGPKYWDTRGCVGGGGAIDLVMHLTGLDFKGTVRRLKELGL